MSRVQCRDCNMEVVVDPTGRCPEGHLVGVAGERIAGSIGAGPRHPDEPEPWVGRVVVDDDGTDEPVAEVRPIRPPSLAVRDDAPVADDTGNEGLLSELASLDDDPGPAPRSGPDELAAATDLETAVHQLSGSVETATPPAPSSSDDTPDGLDELERLEHYTPPPAEPAASNGHHDNGHAPAPPPVSAPSPAEEEDEDARWQALADVAALAKDVPEPSLRSEQASAASAPTSPPPAPPPPAAPPAAEAPAPERAVPPARHRRGDQPGLDMASFTAQGTKVGGRGRRRRFGR